MMEFFNDAKYLLRSGSWRFAKARHAMPCGHAEILNYGGYPMAYRPGTSDVEIIYRVLLKPENRREYRLPSLPENLFVLDIGANIGAFSRLILQQYPKAHIFAFEPEPENFELLLHNLRPFPSARPLNFGLGHQDGTVPFFASDNQTNRGGFSMFAPGSDTQRTIQMEIRGATNAIHQLGVTTVDLLKIDTEGAEYEILTNLSDGFLRAVRWILGELHGQNDFKLLNFLEQNFDIEIYKDLQSRLSHFRAKNKSIFGE